MPFSDFSGDADVAIVDELLHHTEETPALSFVFLGLAFEDGERLLLREEATVVSAEPGAVEQNQVPHGEVSTGALVAVLEDSRHRNVVCYPGLLHEPEKVYELLVEFHGIAGILDAVHRQLERLNDLGNDVLGEDVTALQTDVRGALAEPARKAADVVVETVDVVLGDSSNTLLVEVAIALGEVLEVATEPHLRLRFHLIQHHLPLVGIAFLLKGSGKVAGCEHVEDLSHDPATEELRVRHRTSVEDGGENRVVVLEHFQMAVGKTSDGFFAVCTFHAEEVAYIDSGGAESFDFCFCFHVSGVDGLTIGAAGISTAEVTALADYFRMDCTEVAISTEDYAKGYVGCCGDCELCATLGAYDFGLIHFCIYLVV